MNLVDTALAYGDGHSEQLVGQAVKNSFSKVYVATKIPPMNGIWPASAGTPIEQVFPYEYIIRSTENSLRNLGWSKFICSNSTFGRMRGRTPKSGAGD